MARTFGQNWKSAREASGLGSPEKVSEALATMYPDDRRKQLSRNYIYQLERDEANPTLETMKVLADVYGVPLASIFTVAPADSPQFELPAEYRPIDEILHTLSLADRESILRNVAASLSMQQRIFTSGVTPRQSPPSRPDEGERTILLPEHVSQ